MENEARKVAWSSRLKARARGSTRLLGLTGVHLEHETSIYSVLREKEVGARAIEENLQAQESRVKEH